MDQRTAKRAMVRLLKNSSMLQGLRFEKIWISGNMEPQFVIRGNSTRTGLPVYISNESQVDGVLNRSR